MGRLQFNDCRSFRRLHILVHDRIHSEQRRIQLENAHRLVQVQYLRWHADADTDADADADTDTDSESDTERHSYSDSHSHTESQSHADCLEFLGARHPYTVVAAHNLGLTRISPETPVDKMWREIDVDIPET